MSSLLLTRSDSLVDTRTIARLLACARIGIGVSLFAAPQTAASLWLGHRVTPGGALLARGLGARDVALGVGQLVALDEDGDAGPWLDAGVAADAADALGVLLARRELSSRTVIGTAAVALGAAVTGLALRQRLDAGR